jgi:hypothetical protein
VSDEPQWLTAREAAKRLGVSYSTFMRRQRYELEYRQDVPNGQLLFHVRDVDLYGARTTRRPRNPAA